MAPPDDLPSPRETSLAYGTTGLASLAWIACVIPGTVLLDPSVPEDFATPMTRGALLILPALLLLITGPIAVLLASRPESMRSLLAAGDAFVTLFAAGVFLHGRNGDLSRLVAALALVGLAVVAIRDAVLPARAGPATADAPGPAGGGLRLALASFALLMPTSLLMTGSRERASLLAPFAWVAISALGSRIARGAAGLRLTAAVLLAGVSAHLAVAVRYAVEEGEPATSSWRAAGLVAFGLAAAAFLVTTLWAIGLALRLRGRTS